MKKALLLVMGLVALLAVQAQSDLKFGIKGGLNLSNVRGSDAEGNKGKTGFNAGMFAELPLSEYFSVKPELVYSLQGAKAVNAGEPDVKVNLAYVNLPVLVKYNIISGLFAETGPQIGYLTSAKTKGGGNKEDMKDFFRKVDFSWAFGVGYITPINVGINARYNLGLTKLSKEEDAKVYNGVFQVGVFYVFGGRDFK